MASQEEPAAASAHNQEALNSFQRMKELAHGMSAALQRNVCSPCLQPKQHEQLEDYQNGPIPIMRSGKKSTKKCLKT